MKRRPVWALYVLIVGLALHNLVMAELWDAGVHGWKLDVVSAWKEVVLALALVQVVRYRRGLPFKSTWSDWLAVAYGAAIVLYALIPQSWLGGGATHRGVLFGLRHDLIPVAAYFLGRGLDLTRDELRRVGWTILAAACAVAGFGLIDVYLVPLQWWRDSGAPGWYGEQLGLTYNGLSGLPENYVYNVGNGEIFRRLTSTFLSPLAASYLFVVALLLATAWRRERWALATIPLLFAGLLWTHTRAGILALAGGLLVLAWAWREWWPVAGAAGVVLVGAVFVKEYDRFGPRTHFTASELKIQKEHAQTKGTTTGDPLSGGEASTSSHLRNLRDGIRTVVHHPQGFGLGNAGVSAARTHVRLKAGESTYTELGVEAGLVGALLFIAWALVLFRRVVPRSAWIGASLAAVLALGLQTDAIGVPWLAYVVWTLAGDQA